MQDDKTNHRKINNENPNFSVKAQQPLWAISYLMTEQQPP